MYTFKTNCYSKYHLVYYMNVLNNTINRPLQFVHKPTENIAASSPERMYQKYRYENGIKGYQRSGP